MYRLLVIFITLFLFAGLALSQDAAKYEFSDTPIVGNPVGTDAGEAAVNLPGFRLPYGVAVAGDGKVWCAQYSSRYYNDDEGVRVYPDLFLVVAEKDTGTGVYLDTTEVYNKPLWIWDPVAETIDTIRFLTLPDESIDTLSTGNRGMATDPNGDIIIADNTYDALYKINHLTKEVMAKYVVGGAPARPACDAEGFTYHCDLFGGSVVILDPDDWTAPYNTITDVAAGVNRGMEVSPDGQNVYVQRSGGGILHYTGNVDDGFTISDTLIKNIPMQGVVQWDPAGLLWAGQREEDAPFTFWALDPDQDYAIVDSITFTNWAATAKTDTTTGGYPQPSYLRAPRDAAFSADGNTFYFADYYGYTLKEFKKTAASIGDVSRDVPGTFKLYHNYPNPFNPTTVIPFDLNKQAHVKLKVYDALGREIGTYIDGQMKAGSHNFEFDGSNLASGTYYFKITVDTKVATGKMMLLK
jgi:hypothetical protein